MRAERHGNGKPLLLVHGLARACAPGTRWSRRSPPAGR